MNLARKEKKTTDERKTFWSSQKAAFGPFFWFGNGAKDSPYCFVKDCLQTLLGQSTAFEIFDSTNFFRHCKALTHKSIISY